MKEAGSKPTPYGESDVPLRGAAGEHQVTVQREYSPGEIRRVVD
jgi:hypothetical protein